VIDLLQFVRSRRQAGCTRCGGSGFEDAGGGPVRPGDGGFRKVCVCCGPDRPPGVVAQRELDRLRLVDQKALASIEDRRRILEGLIKAWKCPHRRNEEKERAFVSCLSEAWGAEHAVRISEIERLTGMDPREVKQMAQHLRLVHRLTDLGLPLSSCRGGNGEPGYFFALTADEALAAAQSYWRETLTHLQVLEAMVGRFGARYKLRHAIQELGGQYALVFNEAPRRRGDTEAA